MGSRTIILLLPAAAVAAVASVAVAAVASAGPSASSGEAAPEGSASSSRTGTIEGVVHLSVSDEADPPMLSPYARRRYRPPTPSAPTPGSPTNVIVYVIVEGTPPPPAEATIEQRDRAIVPHVTAIQRGARVHFPNRDDVFHNLFSLSETHEFNLGRYPPGESRSETFPRTGLVRMFCDIHSDMAGTILIVDSWLFARPDARGAYRIEGVPAGRHRVVAWHESAGADTAAVTVMASGSVALDFSLSD